LERRPDGDLDRELVRDPETVPLGERFADALEIDARTLGDAGATARFGDERQLPAQAVRRRAGGEREGALLVELDVVAPDETIADADGRVPRAGGGDEREEQARRTHGWLVTCAVA